MTTWDPRRNALGQFGPGNSGRPYNTRNKTGRKVREAFDKAADKHLATALEEVRDADPATFLRLLIKAVPTPRFDEVDIDEQLTPAQLDERLRDYAARLLAAGYGPLPGEPLPGVPGTAGPRGDGAAGGAKPDGGEGESD